MVKDVKNAHDDYVFGTMYLTERQLTAVRACLQSGHYVPIQRNPQVRKTVIDYFSLALSHGLLLLCLLRVARDKAIDPAVPRPQRRHSAANRDDAAAGGDALDAEAMADDVL